MMIKALILQMLTTSIIVLKSAELFMVVKAVPGSRYVPDGALGFLKRLHTTFLSGWTTLNCLLITKKLSMLSFFKIT